MCQPPCDFSPGGVALCLQQGGDIVKDDDVAHAAFFPRQRRTGAHQGTASSLGIQVELLPPFLAPGSETHGDRRDELAESIVVCGQLGKGTPCGRSQIRS